MTVTPLVAVALAAAALSAPRPAAAQPALSLPDAIARAMAHNPDARAGVVAEQEAAARMTQARAGYLPRVRFEESWQRSNQPAFVFGSGLAQRRLTPADLAPDALAHPPAADNIRTAVTVEQAVFDGRTSADVRAAAIGQQIAAARRQIVEQDLETSVIDAYGAVLVATATVRSASTAVEAAAADRRLAADRRELGRATVADVLQLEVHRARALERLAQATADERITRARLNHLMGEPLETRFALDAAPATPVIDVADPAGLETYAVSHRSEVALADLAERLAATAASAARAAFLPQVSAYGGWELNGDAWSTPSSSWGVGAAVRLTLFEGFADRARLAEAHARVRRLALERAQAEALARLDVQVALARLEAARAGEAAGRAAVDQARESRRIVRERYQSGLVDVAGLLRSADAVEQSGAQQIAAQVSVFTAAAHLQRALGR